MLPAELCLLEKDRPRFTWTFSLELSFTLRFIGLIEILKHKFNFQLKLIIAFSNLEANLKWEKDILWRLAMTLHFCHKDS